MMRWRDLARKPAFLWQGLLIVLPVAVLAAVGFLSLRQDKAIAQSEATERAQAIADELLPKIWLELAPDKHAGELHDRAFGVDENGELIFPAPIAVVPIPKPLDLSQLTDEQGRLWLEARRAEFQSEKWGSSIDALRRFIDSGPPKNFAGAACYSLGLMLSSRGDIQGAAGIFDLVVGNYSDALGESGLPLGTLAKLKLLEFSNLGTNSQRLKEPITLESFCSEVVNDPTSLTPFLLEQAKKLRGSAEIEKWQRLWEQHELLRQLSLAARQYFQTNPRNTESLWTGNVPDNATVHLSTNRFWPQPPAGQPLPRMFWVTLAQPWKTYVTNVTSVSTNGLPIFSAIEVEEQHWLVTHYDDAQEHLGAERQKTMQGLRAAKEKSITLDNEPAHHDARTAPPRFKPMRNRNIANVEISSDMKIPEHEDVATNHWFVCRAEREFGSEITGLLNGTMQIPEYFGIGIEIAGNKLTRSAPDLRAWHHLHYAGKPGGVKKEYLTELATNILASATQTAGGVDALKVNVYLTSASALFERQSARTFWFGSLIGVSALAALIGLAATWRAFQNQLQLGEMKSNFVSSVSHELRAPIASVRLLAESLERGKIQETEKQNEYFRFIGQECRRLSSLIENVLDFSRIEQGRKEYEFEPTDIVALMEQTVKLMESYASERQVRLSLSLPDARASTLEAQPLLDGKAIQQALVNLIDNAIKHSPKGEAVMVGLEVRGAEWGDHGGTLNLEPRTLNLEQRTTNSEQRTANLEVRLWVEDRGEGIPAKEHEKIFERFYRCGSELRRETQGVGIGLSIVKHVVEAHGGRVVVRSEVGQGSRFTIELPVRQEGN